MVMATIKSFTDLSQSKVLSKILPLESADMYYLAKPDDTNSNMVVSDICIPRKSENDGQAFGELYAWSLAALISVIPKHIKDYNVLRIDISENDTSIWYDEIGYGVNNYLPNITMESAVDACYEMIIRLNELNLL